MARGLSGFLRGHAAVTTQLDAAETLDIVFDLLRAVEGLLGNLAGGLLFHQVLVADDCLVGDGATHVVDGPAAWDHLTGRTFVLHHETRQRTEANMYHQRYIG